MSYFYYKAHLRSESPYARLKNSITHRLIRIMPNVLIVIGATAVTTVAYPMFSYKINNQRWEAKKIISPVSDENQWQIGQVSSKQGDPATPAIAYQDKQQVEVTNIDYTKASNWFPESKIQVDGKSKIVTTYTLSIPKLDIKDMTVLIGGDSLDEHLIQYAGTALPGEYGNPVIFGHSVLPVFYNPKSYMSVFSLLPTLDEGDEIFIKYDGIEYKYEVESYHEVMPDAIEVLEQRYDRKTLTLITCVPPGTYQKRGVMLAQLVEN